MYSSKLGFYNGLRLPRVGLWRGMGFEGPESILIKPVCMLDRAQTSTDSFCGEARLGGTSLQYSTETSTASIWLTTNSLIGPPEHVVGTLGLGTPFYSSKNTCQNTWTYD